MHIAANGTQSHHSSPAGGAFAYVEVLRCCATGIWHPLEKIPGMNNDAHENATCHHAEDTYVRRLSRVSSLRLEHAQNTGSAPVHAGMCRLI